METEFTEMAPRIYRFLVRLCGDPERASDLAQEVLARGWQRRDQLSHPEALPTWLFRIAVRTWNDAYRRSSSTAESLTDEIVDLTPQPIDISIGNEVGAFLWRQMGALPERQQQVLHLRVVEQMEISQIAEVIGTNQKNVRSNLAVARKKLRESLKAGTDSNVETHLR